ncbi:MAG: Spx/MgsR family RNA polymerase-binding regulatory protein [Chthoniobacteraceae bacterium]
MLKIYTYANCSTCRNATKWLKSRAIPCNELPIREQPPTREELAEMLGALEARGGSLRLLFNTSGQDYRAMNLKEQLPNLSPTDAFALLSSNGNLVKRPFAMDPKAGIYLVGFNEVEWTKAFSKE